MFRIDSDGIARDEMEVRSADTDRFFKAKIPFFFSMLQEISAKHSSASHCGIPEFVKRENKTWVIVRARITVFQFSVQISRTVSEIHPPCRIRYTGVSSSTVARY